MSIVKTLVVKRPIKREKLDALLSKFAEAGYIIQTSTYLPPLVDNPHKKPRGVVLFTFLQVVGTTTGEDDTSGEPGEAETEL